MIDPQKLQILLDVLQRAPVTRAEQLIIGEVVDRLIAMSTPVASPPTPDDADRNGAATHPLPRQQQP